MYVDLNSGLLKASESANPVLFIPSPNFNARPLNMPIDLLVIHAISLPPGMYTGNSVIDFFCNKLDISQHHYFQEIKDLKVSAHLFIKRDGQIIQFVPFLHRAWHAGNSSFRGREACNDFSIGIELEGTDYEKFTDTQYASLSSCTKALISAYPNLNFNNIVGHQDISPGRKSDPGPFFDWNRYRSSFG
jgi:AmpD protein